MILRRIAALVLIGVAVTFGLGACGGGDDSGAGQASTPGAATTPPPTTGGSPATPAPAPEERRSFDVTGGTTAIELVLVAPVFLAVLLMAVGLGRIVEAEGRVQGAARDAARAASLARSGATAAGEAREAAAANLAELGVTCTTFAVNVDTGDFRPGGAIRVSVACTADLAGLALAGLPGAKTIRAEAVAPLEQYRGTG